MPASADHHHYCDRDKFIHLNDRGRQKPSTNPGNASLAMMALHAAVLANNVTHLKQHLKNGLSPNAPNNVGATPLHHAAKHNLLDITRVLLTSQDLISDIQDSQGKTALHLAIEAHHFTVASYLIEHGARIDLKDNNELSPLDYCLSMRQPLPSEASFSQFFHLHLPTIAKVRLKSARKAVLILSYWDCSVLLDELVIFEKECASFQDKYKQSPLHYCFAGEHRVSMDSANILLRAGADINERNVDGDTPLHFLASHEIGNERPAADFVVRIIASHAQKEGMSPLHLSAVTGDTELLKYLSSCGADLNLVDQDSFSALHLAALHGHVEVVRALLKRKVNLNPENQRGQIPLHYACVLPRITCAKLFLQAGAPVERQDQFGMTPLHKAAGWGTPDMVKLLIQQNVSVNMTDFIDQLPIHYSALKGQTEITEILITKGSRVECSDNKGQTPLHLAAKTGNEDIIKLLLLHGADPNTQDVRGQSPLHLACCHGNKDAVQTLINRGASKNVVTAEGHKPEQFALDRGFYGILSILREHRQSLSLYAPEQLKTFEMFRNSTAPNRLESLGHEDEEEEDNSHGDNAEEVNIDLVSEIASVGASREDTGIEVNQAKMDVVRGDENANLRLESSHDVGVKTTGQQTRMNTDCCTVS